MCKIQNQKSGSEQKEAEACQHLTLPQEKELLHIAMQFMMEKHAGQIRTGGLPYYTHPAHVCQIIRKQGYPKEYQLTALLHDLLEDTDAKPEEIERIAGAEVLDAVEILTKTPGYQMESYIREIRENPIAKAVKAADRLHNLQSAVVCSKSFKRRYIEETRKWYLDFLPEIEIALQNLISSLNDSSK